VRPARRERFVDHRPPEAGGRADQRHYGGSAPAAPRARCRPGRGRRLRQRAPGGHPAERGRPRRVMSSVPPGKERP
jgi:hypothetical protein